MLDIHELVCGCRATVCHVAVILLSRAPLINGPGLPALEGVPVHCVSEIGVVVVYTDKLALSLLQQF